MTKVEVEKIATLTGHRDCIYTLERGADEQYVVSAGGDGMIARWDLATPEEGRLIAQVEGSVYAMRRVRDTNELIVGQNHEGLHFIDLQDQKETGSIRLTSAQIFDIQVFQNLIYTGCGDGTVMVIDREKVAVVGKARHSDERVRSIALHPDRGELAVGYSDNMIRILDLNDLSVINTLEGHTNSVFSVVYDYERGFLLSGSRDAHLKVWATEENYTLHQSIVAHMYAINHIIFRPDYKYFATCSMDKSVKVWDAATHKLIKVIDKARHAGHATSVNKLLWTDYNGHLVSGSDDRSLSVWEIDIKE